VRGRCCGEGARGKEAKAEQKRKDLTAAKATVDREAKQERECLNRVAAAKAQSGQLKIRMNDKNRVISWNL
jgi:hypothetical protein